MEIIGYFIINEKFFSGIAKVLKDKKYLYRIYSIENWVYYTFFTRKVIRSFFGSLFG